MRFTEEQVKKIKDFALKELHYRTHDPVEAVLHAVQMLLTSECLIVVKEPAGHGEDATPTSVNDLYFPVEDS